MHTFDIDVHFVPLLSIFRNPKLVKGSGIVVAIDQGAIDS